MQSVFEDDDFLYSKSNPGMGNAPANCCTSARNALICDTRSVSVDNFCLYSFKRPNKRKMDICNNDFVNCAHHFNWGLRELLLWLTDKILLAFYSRVRENVLHPENTTVDKLNLQWPDSTIVSLNLLRLGYQKMF